MNLYRWNCKLFGSDYSIYALAENLESAREIAIQKASNLSKVGVSEAVNNVDPIVYNEQDSFIMVSSPQLV